MPALYIKTQASPAILRSSDVILQPLQFPGSYVSPAPHISSIFPCPAQSLRTVWTEKKAHGPADGAGLTSAEIARRDRLAKEKAERTANRAANHAPESAEEEDPGLLPPSTAPPRLEESGSMKRKRGRTIDFVALHTGTANKKGKP